MVNKLENVLDQRIQQFFNSKAFGVVGASNNREKYGSKVLRCYLQHHKNVYPINPNEEKIEEIPCVSSVAELPDDVKSLSIITPPSVTEKIVAQAIDKGIENIWMQPGAESRLAVEKCEQNNINVISGGPCILVVMKYHDSEMQ
jgi:uncharacterized protein